MEGEEVLKVLHKLLRDRCHMNILVNLMAFFNVVSQIGRFFLACIFCWDRAFCLASSPANTLRIPVLKAYCHVQLTFYWEESSDRQVVRDSIAPFVKC